MHYESLVASLARFPSVIRGLLDGLDDEALRWRPREGAWSLLEILGHVEEEERRDFRPRIERTLADPVVPWDGIDPEAWAREHGYQEADAREVLQAFESERARSVAWLAGLAGADWSRAYEHPALGTLRAGDLLASWCAHDALHLRQLATRLHQLLARDAEPFDAGYAGPPP